MALQAARSCRTLVATSSLQPALSSLRATWAPAVPRQLAAPQQLQRRSAASRVVLAAAETEVAGKLHICPGAMHAA